MTKIQEELEKFVVNNDDLEKLEIELSKFNLFEKLSLEHYEIRHSNTLAYLFNPKEDHGLSDYFLKKFLMSVYSNNNVNISPIAIDSMNFSDAIIKREYKNIDLLIISNSNKYASSFFRYSVKSIAYWSDVGLISILNELGFSRKLNS